MGATVTGIDPSAEIIAAARLHAAESGLAIDYRAATAEELAAAGEKFDVVMVLEVAPLATVARFKVTLVAGLKLVAPTTAYNAKGLLISAIRDDGPVVFLDHKFLGNAAKGPVPPGAITCTRDNWFGPVHVFGIQTGLLN